MIPELRSYEVKYVEGLVDRIAKLEAGLRDVRNIAACSEGVEFYVMLADKALQEVSDECKEGNG